MLYALQGWICPYCRQPVFLKGAHLRHRKGRAARVDAHFCHYSTADDLLCILFNPNKSQESSTETLQGVAHHQILSLFYSLPSQEETSSWHNDLIRQEALSLAWLLDSLEIGSIEEDEQSFTWPVGMRCLPILWRQGYTGSLRLMAELLRKAVLKEQSTSPIIDVSSYIYLLPLIRPQKPKIEIIGHKSLSKALPPNKKGRHR